MSDTNFIESSTPMVNSVLHATKILDYYASQRREYLSLKQPYTVFCAHCSL